MNGPVAPGFNSIQHFIQVLDSVPCNSIAGNYLPPHPRILGSLSSENPNQVRRGPSLLDRRDIPRANGTDCKSAIRENLAVASESITGIRNSTWIGG